jgi:hypothetical protein
MENETYAKTEVTGREFVAGFSISGEYIKNLDDKTFEIMKQRSELVPDLDNSGIKKEKLILTVRMADGTVLDYFPNKTSQKVIIAKRGYRLEAWVGYKGLFYTENQKVGATKRDVIYIDDKYSFEEVIA